MKYKALACLVVAGVVFADPAVAAEAMTGDAAGCRHGSVLNIAHRGGIVDGFPENTLAAYRRAIAIGVDAIEIDLRGTSDGEVVILHDDTLDRTTDGQGPVSEHTLAALKQLDAGDGERIPTYTQVLETVTGSGVKLLLDIKLSPALDREKVVRLTEAHGAVLDVIAGVRTLADLAEFRRLNPNIRTLGFVKEPDDIEAFVTAGVDIVRVWPAWIEDDSDIVERVHKLGKPVWTTAGEATVTELEALACAGVNGILSDYPLRATFLVTFGG